MSSGIFLKHNSWEVHVVSVVFMFGGALYCQGGGIHTASNMYKHAIEDYKEDNQPDQVSDHLPV